MKKLIMLAVLGGLLFASCASRESIVYYQDIDQQNRVVGTHNTLIQPDDLLMIIVSAQNPLAAEPYNLTTNLTVDPNDQAGTARRQQQLYLVDSEGYIDFPVLGRLLIGGKTKEQVSDEMHALIAKDIKDAVINIRLMNYKVTVMGEVNRPGVHKINSERITLPEALSLSGDLTKYGKRDNILITRETTDGITTQRVDLTSTDFMQSDYFYLKQNDIVYVEPNKTRVNSSGVGPNISIYLTVISLLLTATALILSNT
ncbi:MAG: polysaccharide biosynthesis/export family protein, partial [Myroides sp.]|nr:polysaccharide biosynthesis/export family protein [Myroides sp.]